MGFFKKPTVPVAHDDEIRREIRARVAKQVGLDDEEYIKTGKIGGKKTTNVPDASAVPDATAEVVPVSVTAEEIEQPTPKSSEINNKPNTESPSVKEIIPPEKEKEPAAKEKTPSKEKEPVAKEKTPSKDKKASSGKKSPKKKKSTVPLIIFILLLILAFIPFYYYFTGVASHGTDNVLIQEK